MSKVWKIYSKGSNTSNDTPKYLAESVEYHDTWMGEEYVMVTIVTDKSPNPNDPDPFSLEIGDFIEYRGRRYFIYNVPSALKQARKHTYGEAFKYENVKFSSVGMELSEVRFLDIVLGDNQIHYTSLPTFSAYCETVEDLVDRLQANTDREHNGNDSWYFITPNKQRTLGRCIKWNGSAWVPDTERRAVAETLWNEAFSNGSYLENENKNVSINVDKVSVWDGLGMVKNHFGLNFVLSPTTLGRVVVIGAMASDTGHDFMYGKGNGLHQIERVADSDQMVVTKLFAYGSDTNLPYHYYAELGRKPYFIVTDKRAVEFIVGHPQYTLYTNIAFASISPSLNGVDNKVTLYVGNQYCTAWCEAYTPQGRTTEYTLFRLIGTMQSDSPDGLLYNQITVNSTRVYISSGVNTSKWPNIEQDQYGLPDNMAVNCLMLLGFPKYALNDVVRCEYDLEINVTKFFIRRTPSDTYSSTPSFAVNGNHVLTFSTDRLRPWIKSPNVVDLGVKEGDVHFTEETDDNGLQDVHPSIEGMTENDVFHNGSSARLDEIIAVDTIEDDGYFADGEVETIPNFTITVRDLGFDLRQAYVDAGSSMKVSMKDGYCGGRDFDVKGVTQLANGQWKLTIARCPDNALELYFPYSNSVAGGGTAQANEPYQIRGPHEENGVMVSGDHFVLTDILIYDTNYVYAASVELFKKSVLWIISNDYTRFTYMPKIDEIFMAKNQETAYSSQYYKLKAGKLMHFEDEDLGIDAKIFIDQLTIKEGGGQNVPTYDVVLREDKEVGTIQRMQNQISSIQSSIGSVGDNTALAYIKSLWKLDEDNHLYTEYDVYSKKSVSALGFSESEGGGGGATRLDGLSDVTITNPVTNQVLKYDATLNNNQGGWVNAQDTGGMTINDMWNALATPYPPQVQKIIDLTHIPVLSPEKIPSLDAGKITSGTFDANRVPNIENLNNFSTRVYDATAERTANTVLAAPNGSNGAASFRSLVGNDLPIATDLTRGAVRIGSTLAISSGVLNLPTSGVVLGTYTKLTVDAYGRATYGTTLSTSDIPDLSETYVARTGSSMTGNLSFGSGYGISISYQHGDPSDPESDVIEIVNGVVSVGYGGDITIGGNSVWHAGNFTPSDYLPLSAGSTKALTGDLYLGSHSLYGVVDATLSGNLSVVNITASGYVQTSSYIKIGNVYLTYDQPNNAIRVSANANGTGAANFYAIGGVSALGYSASGGGGGASALSDLTDVQITNVANGQILRYDGTHWINVTPNYATTTQLLNYLPLSGGGTITDSDSVQMLVNNHGLSWKVSGTTYASIVFSMDAQSGPVINLSSATKYNGYDIRNSNDTYIDLVNSRIYIGGSSINVGGTTVSFGTEGTDYVPITIGSTTKNVLTAHQSLTGYATTSDLSNYLPLSGGGTIYDSSSDYTLSIDEDSISFGYNGTTYGTISLSFGVDGAEFDISNNATIGGNTIIHSGNIGSQSVNFANSSNILGHGVQTNGTHVLSDGDVLVYDSNSWMNYAITSLSVSNADTVDNEHASAFAHVGQWNDLLTAGYEFNFISNGFSGGLWFNYQDGNRQSEAIVSGYYFGNGRSGYDVTLYCGGVYKYGYGSSAYVLTTDGGVAQISGLSVGNADTVDSYHATDLFVKKLDIYGIENLAVGVDAGGNTTVSNGAIITSGAASDTYFYLDTSEYIEAGQTYTFGFYVSGWTGSSGSWKFYASYSANCVCVDIKGNGWYWGTGVMIPYGSSPSNQILIDDKGGDYRNLTISKFTLVKGTAFPYYTTPISQMSVASATYATSAGSANILGHAVQTNSSHTLTDGDILVYDTGVWNNFSIVDYATKTWVSRNYLSLEGGTMTGDLYFGAGIGIILDTDSSIVVDDTDLNLHINGYDATRFKVNGTEYMTLLQGGNVGIGTTNPSYKLHVNGQAMISQNVGIGTAPASGYALDIDGTARASSFVNNSDIRKKDVLNYDAEPQFYAVANAPAIRFKWKERSSMSRDMVCVGSVAQYWQSILPDAVMSDEKGYLSMQYDVIALLSAIAVAKRVTEHERRIEQLERENALLRMEINELKDAA